MKNLITYNYFENYIVVYVENEEDVKNALDRALDDLMNIYGLPYEVDFDGKQYMFLVSCFDEFKEFTELFNKYL